MVYGPGQRAARVRQGRSGTVAKEFHRCDAKTQRKVERKLALDPLGGKATPDRPRCPIQR
jgi:hypothetical protein